MTSLYRRPACGHVRWGRSVSHSTASNASAVLIGRKKSREYLILVCGCSGCAALHLAETAYLGQTVLAKGGTKPTAETADISRRRKKTTTKKTRRTDRLTESRFYVPLDTKIVIFEMLFPASEKTQHTASRQHIECKYRN